MTHSPKIDWETHSAATARELEVLWVTFVKLQRLRFETMTDIGMDELAAAGEPGLVDAILAPISSELCRLALIAASIGAHCQEDIEYKAVMLSEFLSVEDKSVQTTLTRSLIRDIKNSRCASHAVAQPEFQLTVAT